MNTRLFEVLSIPEFWIALCFAIMIAGFFAVIGQNIWDTLMDLRDEECFEASLKPINRGLEFGELLWDVYNEREVLFVGYANSGKLIVTYTVLNTVFVEEVTAKELRLIGA